MYLNQNPLRGNTYRRLHDGDRKCSDEVVSRMLAEQTEDSRDTKILKGFIPSQIEKNSENGKFTVFYHKTGEKTENPLKGIIEF